MCIRAKTLPAVPLKTEMPLRTVENIKNTQANNDINTVNKLMESKEAVDYMSKYLPLLGMNKYGGRAYPTAPYYPYQGDSLRVNKNYDKTHVQPTAFNYGGTVNPYYQQPTVTPYTTTPKKYENGGETDPPYPELDVLSFTSPEQKIIQSKLDEANKAQLEAYEGYGVDEWQSHVAGEATRFVPQEDWTGYALGTPDVQGSYPAPTDNPNYTTSTSFASTGNIVNNIDSSQQGSILGDYYSSRLGNLDFIDNPLYQRQNLEMLGYDDDGSLTGDKYYNPQFSLNTAPSMPYISSLTTGTKEVPMLNPDYGVDMQANKQRNRVRRNSNKANYMRNVNDRKAKKALMNKYLYQNPNYDMNNPTEGVNQYVPYSELRGKYKRNAVPATEQEVTYFKNNNPISERQYTSAKSENDKRYNEYVQNVKNWNNVVNQTKDFFEFTKKRGGKLEHGGTHPTYAEIKNAENRKAFEAAQSDWLTKENKYDAAVDKYEEDKEKLRLQRVSQQDAIDALEDEQERVTQARKDVVRIGKDAYYDPEYRDQILNYYIKPGEWNDFNPMYCSTRSCELERAAGYTIANTGAGTTVNNRELIPGNPVSIIPGTRQWQSYADEQGYDKINPRNIQPGDRIFYGGNSPYHSLIYAGKEGDDYMVLNDHGAGDDFDLNPS